MNVLPHTKLLKIRSLVYLLLMILKVTFHYCSSFLISVDTRSMRRRERLFRIVFGFILLVVAKLLLLTSSLYLKTLVEQSAAGNTVRTIELGWRSSTFGLFIGVGASRIVSGIVQLVCDLILSPAVNSAGIGLPREAFSAALIGASRRCDDGAPTQVSALSVVAEGQDEGKSGAARRALDRGVKASGQFIYRSLFNLFPKFVDSTCVLLLLGYKAGRTTGLVAFFVAYFYAYITAVIMQRRIPLLRAQLREQSVANGFAEDALSLAETVAAFGAIRDEEKRYVNALHGTAEAGVAVRRSFAYLKLIQSLVLGLGSTAVALSAWYSSPHLSGPALSSQMAFVQSLFGQLCVPLDTFGVHFRDAVSAAEDLRELEDLKFRMTPFKQVQELSSMNKAGKTVPKILRQEGGRVKWRSESPRVQVDSLFYVYPVAGDQMRYALRNISFTIPAGGYSVGIVGPSGSGKSTLFRVLLGLEPLESGQYNSGKIFLDGIDVTYSDRTPCFSLVGQENDLFRSLSLANNIRYGTNLDSNFSDIGKVALLNAAQDAQLEHLIGRIPGGWNASVGPRGRILSGGERQRVCLARALYREEINGGILLLDECTAALDAKTEDLVIRALHSRVQKGATAVLVAHRLSSVQRCDMIIVLKDGEIAQKGTHHELIAAGGWYAESWKVQQQQKK